MAERVGRMVGDQVLTTTYLTREARPELIGPFPAAGGIT